MENQERHLAREILATGLVLAALMDEFHPENLLQSSAVERLVRRLLFHEMSLAVDKRHRGQWLINNMAFMGLSGGASPETESAISV